VWGLASAEAIAVATTRGPPHVIEIARVSPHRQTAAASAQNSPFGA
jgi:hypothetical protein